MSYDQIVTWIEEHMPSRHFTDYRDLGKFRDDYDGPDGLYNNLPGTADRARNFQTRMDDWLKGKFPSKTTYEDVQSDIESNKIEDIKGMKIDDAKSELEEMKEQDVYTPETIAKVEKIVEGKGEIDTADIFGRIESATSQADINAIGTRGQIRRDYGERADEILERIDAKAGEMKTLSEEARDELAGRIGSATTPSRLEELEGEIEETPNLTASLRDELRGMVRGRMDELGG